MGQKLSMTRGYFRPQKRRKKKCFLNPIGFRKFFECFPNHYAKDFVGRRKNYHKFYAKFDTFFFSLHLIWRGGGLEKFVPLIQR